MKQDTKNAREVTFDGFKYDEFFNNRLSLPDAFKENLTKQNLDWRFINAEQFRIKGNQHRAHWKPYQVPNPKEVGIDGLTPEGLIQRGDLILAVRDKKVSTAHKKFLNERNQRYQGHNKQVASELRQMAREAGMSDSVKVYEGYDENE